MLERDPFVNWLGLSFKVLAITSLELDPLLFKTGPSEDNGELSPQRRSHDLVNHAVQPAADNAGAGQVGPYPAFHTIDWVRIYQLDDDLPSARGPRLK